MEKGGYDDRSNSSPWRVLRRRGGKKEGGERELRERGGKKEKSCSLKKVEETKRGQTLQPEGGEKLWRKGVWGRKAFFFGRVWRGCGRGRVGWFSFFSGVGL